MGKHGPMLLGGHRGMGENLAMQGPDGTLGVYPAFRENTIQSFKEAVKCGVGFVEFDVQVTRDNVPVIWHDDDVVSGPVDHPSRPQVKDLTYAELQALCGATTASHPDHPHAHTHTHTHTHGHGHGTGTLCGGSEDASDAEACGGGLSASASVVSGDSPLHARLRGCSEDGSSELSGGSEGAGGALLRRFRDRKTRQWASRYEPWRCSRDDTIPTLEDVFHALPPEVGFDIEIKMTTGDDVVHTPAEEVDRMLTAILPVVDRCASPPPPPLPPSAAPPPALSAPAPASNSSADEPLDFIAAHEHEGDGASSRSDPHDPHHHRRRRIMFSSFDPDVCVELRRRQGAHPYPVYYLSGCGLYEHADARRTSIPAALAFAEEAGMRGVVVPASVLLKNMDMVATASSRQLQLMTYGLENNDLDSLRRQADAGVAAAIVDEVAGVTAALGGSGAGGDDGGDGAAEEKAEAGKEET